METNTNTVTCLGMTFSSEEERRVYFREELRKKLPELRKLEGFPIGEAEDIINLSDPPYYTPCPNPWLNDFILHWENDKKELEKQKKRSNTFAVKEPYASDISEGKTNPLYAAHGYHTKVPHLAIMRYILHYTQPGDIIFDGFAGTGMTGVASLLCRNPDPELRFKIDSEFKENGLKNPQWGVRKVMCGDLSPIAGFIASNYMTANDVLVLEKNAKRILKELETECGWMYGTKHTDGKTGRINYTVWSEVFVCSHCGQDIVFYESAFDKNERKIRDEFHCPSCSAICSKNSLDLIYESVYDQVTNSVVQAPKRIPVLINYTIHGKKFEKKPDKNDEEIISRTIRMELPNGFPTDKLPDMQMVRVGRMKPSKITHIHHFFLPRQQQALGTLWQLVQKVEDYRERSILFWFAEQAVWGMSVLCRYVPTHYSQVNQFLSGVFYVASQIVDASPWYILDGKLKRILKALQQIKPMSGESVVFTGDCGNTNISDNSVDYVFTDPPFGENIYYSDLNILLESWHRVLTNTNQEAIIDRVKGKDLSKYQSMMTNCFEEYFRVLKPGHWLTVEFSNTSAAVWNGIQLSLQRAGFIVANVAALDKKQGSFQAVTSPTAVKQDLIISCYKPSAEFQRKFLSEDNETSVMIFVSEHIDHLPLSIVNEKSATAVIERSPKILYDRLITYFLMRGLPIPVDASKFQQLLKNQFSERDGMVFTPEQAVLYDEQKARLGITKQLSLVFDIIYSENDAVLWLKEKLGNNPQKYQQVQPDFRKANTATRRGEKEFELRTLLEENFIELPDGRWRVPDPNEGKDREILRNKALLREFGRYAEDLSISKAKKLKDVRVEALRAGFRNCWEKRDFGTIVQVGEKIPQNILMEDEQLLTFFDIANDRM